MPNKEQFARVWLVTLVVSYGAYFWFASNANRDSLWDQLLIFAATTIAQIIVIAIGSAVIALNRSQGPSIDERDRAIDNKATRVAYNVLIAGVILSGCILPFSHSGWVLFQAAVAAIAVSEIVRYSIIVGLYRRGGYD